MEQMKIEEFERLDLRIGRIKDAARMEGSKKLIKLEVDIGDEYGRNSCLLYTSPSPRDKRQSRMPSSA